MNHPFFHIVIPALNESKTVSNILSDLSKQIYTDFSVTLVDGHSDDDTVIKAKKFTSLLPSFTILTSDVRNVCYQRNLGAKNATSPYLLFFDCDNRLPSHFLLGIRYHLVSKPADIFTTSLSTKSANTNPIIPTMINLYTDFRQYTPRPFILESCFGIKTPLFNQVGGFNQKDLTHEGEKLITRCQPCQFAVFKNPTYHYSQRRFFGTQGALKSISKNIILEVASMLDINLSPDQEKTLYPMLGGNSYQKKPKKISKQFFDELKKIFTD